MNDMGRPGSIEPHPVLPEYYSDASRRATFVRDLFNETAPHYDRINKIFSLGSGSWYRRRALKEAGLRPGLRVLDVAIGTGLIAREAIRVTGDKAGVIGLDVSERMLAEAGKLGIPLIHGRAEQLPMADESVDFLSMGYALRHLADLRETFGEFHRVLRPGGTLLLLEIGNPRPRFYRDLLSAYLGHLVPLLARWTRAGRRGDTLMRYYWETIARCVSPDVILDAIRGAGFVDVGCKVDASVFRAYIGRKSR